MLLTRSVTCQIATSSCRCYSKRWLTVTSRLTFAFLTHVRANYAQVQLLTVRKDSYNSPTLLTDEISRASTNSHVHTSKTAQRLWMPQT